MRRPRSTIAVHLVIGQGGCARRAFVKQYLAGLGRGASHTRLRDCNHLTEILASHRGGPLVVEAADEAPGAIPALDLIDVIADSKHGRFRLADVIAVVSAPQFFSLFDQECDDEHDEATALERLINDIELASVVALADADQLTEVGDEARIRDVLVALNPDARFASEPGQATPFDLARSHRDVPWLQVPCPEALSSGGVGVFKYRARRPFHPARLAATLARPWAGVLRSKGFVWIASRGDERGVYLQSGGCWRLDAAGPWWASVPQEDWPHGEADIADIRAVWDLRSGDRRQEVVFVGRGLDSGEIRRDLDACLLDASEMAAGPSNWSWLPDPLPLWDDAVGDDEAVEHSSDSRDEPPAVAAQSSKRAVP